MLHPHPTRGRGGGGVYLLLSSLLDISAASNRGLCLTIDAVQYGTVTFNTGHLQVHNTDASLISTPQPSQPTPPLSPLWKPDRHQPPGKDPEKVILCSG